MTIKCQIPYNFMYDNTLVQYLSKYKDIIHSVYFGFSNGSRPTKKNSRDLEYHLDKLAKIKHELGDVKFSYVLNSVISIEIEDKDSLILSIGIVDIVTIARDDVYDQVENIVRKNNLNVQYEVSRLYDYVDENKNRLKEAASFVMYGFEHELQSCSTENGTTKLGYLVNEQCYPFCKTKLLHNTNVLLRNLGKTEKKFSCPYNSHSGGDNQTSRK